MNWVRSRFTQVHEQFYAGSSTKACSGGEWCSTTTSSLTRAVLHRKFLVAFGGEQFSASSFTTAVIELATKAGSGGDWYSASSSTGAVLCGRYHVCFGGERLCTSSFAWAVLRVNIWGTNGGELFCACGLLYFWGIRLGLGGLIASSLEMAVLCKQFHAASRMVCCRWFVDGGFFCTYSTMQRWLIDND